MVFLEGGPDAEPYTLVVAAVGGGAEAAELAAGAPAPEQSHTLPAMPSRRRQRDPSALKTVRLGLAPKLTREETRKLEARAAADLRPVANYVAYLIAQDLRGKRRSRRPSSAKPG